MAGIEVILAHQTKQEFIIRKVILKKLAPAVILSHLQHSLVISKIIRLLIGESYGLLPLQNTVLQALLYITRITELWVNYQQGILTAQSIIIMAIIMVQVNQTGMVKSILHGPVAIQIPRN